MYCTRVARREGTITTTTDELPMTKLIEHLAEKVTKLTPGLSDYSYNTQNAFPRK